MDCFFFPEHNALIFSGERGAQSVMGEGGGDSPCSETCPSEGKDALCFASPEDSSEKNPKGRHLKVTLLSIFQICVSLTGIFTHPTGTGTARSYLGQRRDRVRTL